MSTGPATLFGSVCVPTSTATIATTIEHAGGDEVTSATSAATPGSSCVTRVLVVTQVECTSAHSDPGVASMPEHRPRPLLCEADGMMPFGATITELE